MGRASRANPLSREAAAGRLIRPVVMPRTKQRVSPARMSSAGLAAWTQARLQQDVVLDEALIERMVAKASRDKREAVRTYLENLLAGARRAKRQADADTDVFIASNVRFRGGLDHDEAPIALEAPERISVADMRRLMEFAVRQGDRLTPEAPSGEDRPR